MLPNKLQLESDLTIDYWPDFLSPAQADELLRQLQAMPNWAQHQIQMFGKTVNEPRLSAFVGDTGLSYRYSRKLRKSEPWPPAVSDLLPKILSLTNHDFNCALLNYYRDGDDCMGWHSDDEVELGENPAIASLSLGGERDFKLRHNISRAQHSIPLAHGSLLLMPPGTQSHWQHSISRSRRVQSARINLTFRKIVAKQV